MKKERKWVTNFFLQERNKMNLKNNLSWPFNILCDNEGELLNNTKKLFKDNDFECVDGLQQIKKDVKVLLPEGGFFVEKLYKGERFFYCKDVDGVHYMYDMEQKDYSEKLVETLYSLPELNNSTVVDGVLDCNGDFTATGLPILQGQFEPTMCYSEIMKALIHTEFKTAQDLCLRGFFKLNEDEQFLHNLNDLLKQTQKQAKEQVCLPHGFVIKSDAWKTWYSVTIPSVKEITK